MDREPADPNYYFFCFDARRACLVENSIFFLLWGLGTEQIGENIEESEIKKRGRYGAIAQSMKEDIWNGSLHGVLATLTRRAGSTRAHTDNG